MRRSLVLAAVVAFAGGLVVAQNPMRQAYYFTDTGGNDATAGIVYSRDSSDNPQLHVQFTTSDTNALRINADGLTEIDSSGNLFPVVTVPSGDATTGHFAYPANGAADAVTTTTDNALLCERAYLPYPLTVANAYVRGIVGTDSGSDETLAIGIYNDADAGTQITEGVGADLTTSDDVTINVTDVSMSPGFYRFCFCAQDISGAAFHAETRDDEYIDVINADTVVFGTAANACVTGNPPATTGALTTADDNMPVFKIGG